MSLSRRFLLLAAFGALIAGLLLLPGLGGGFLLDDKPAIPENAAVQVATLDAGQLMQAAYSYGGGARALPMLSFALDHWRGGLDPAAFKATNIAIHVLTTLALAWFFRLLLAGAGWPATRTTYAAPLLALAWAVHPLQVSSVLYIVQRMQTMGTLFLVLALCAYLKMRYAQIAGERSRQYGVLAVLCWVLALASKEDSILLPAYTLALELTVLRFRTASAALENRLRRGYQLLVVLGVAVFVLVLVPKHWYPDSYPGRDFSSLERLLTQGRVLAMYLGQVLWPLPSHLPFYYDDLQPSRSLLQPWTTLPALLLVFGLLALAWRLRHRRPLLSLGILLFFAGHAVSSNIIGLELAFEHRNHFPLIGAVLAIGDALRDAFERLRLRPATIAPACLALVAALSSATLLRAQAWGSRIGFAEYGTQIAPRSERAWIDLCQTHFELSGNRPADPHFAKALATCAKGATLRDGATNLTNLVLLKTINGSVRQSDWEQLFERMRRVTLTPSNVGVAWHLVRYSNGDKRIAPRNVIAIIDIISKRSDFRPEEYAAFGYYAAKNGLGDDALRFFALAIETSPPASQLPQALLIDLQREGYPRWAAQLTPLVHAHRGPRNKQSEFPNATP